jgi:hypothetical protein
MNDSRCAALINTLLQQGARGLRMPENRFNGLVELRKTPLTR